MIGDGPGVQRVLDALDRHGGHPRAVGRAYRAYCPVHADTHNPSLEVKQGRDGALIKCWSDCAKPDIMSALGLTMADLFDTVKEPKPQDRPAAREVRLVRSNAVLEYPYYGADGHLVYSVARFEPGPDGRNKSFLPYLPGATRAGIGNIARVLYRLPQLRHHIEHNPDGDVWLTEGEKDADTLAALGLTAITNCSGADGWSDKHVRRYIEQLAGATHVIVIADDDAAGHKRAQRAAADLSAAGIAVDVKLPTVGKDVTDHLAAGCTIDDLRPAPELGPGHRKTTSRAERAVDSAEAASKTTSPDTPAIRAANMAASAVTSTAHTVRVHELDAHRGQLRMAGRFSDQWQGHLRYVHGIGWHQWDGTRWAPSRDGGPMRCAMRTARDALRELADIDDKNTREELFADIRRVESANGLRGVLEIASNIKPLACSPDKLDTDPYLFNVANGTFDLRTMALRSHDPTDLITKIAGCGYEPDAPAPTWGKFIAEVLPDASVRGFVQRLFGYSLLGKVREHMLPQFTGTGRNGKGTLRDIVKAAFGEYAIEVNPSIVMTDGAKSHPTERADLLGARLVFTSETDENAPLAAATMKRLVGGDPIRARRMGKDFFEFDPSHTLIMITNHLPVVAGDDKAVWARLRVVPFEQDFTAVQDPGLGDRLALDLAAVLAWCVQGYRLYAEGGLTEPEAVAKSTAEYHDLSDPLGRFLTECTLSSPHAYVRAGELYEAWRTWCRDNGEKELGKLSNVKFAEMLKRKGIGRESRSFGNVYVGLGLAATEDGEPE